MLVQITSDRSDLVERIRQEYLTGEKSLGTSDRAVLLLVTSGFERVIWMKHRLALCSNSERQRQWVTAAKALVFTRHPDGRQARHFSILWTRRCSAVSPSEQPLAFGG